MHVGRHEAEQTIARSRHKESQRDGLIGTLLKLIEGAVMQLHSVEKGSEVKLTLCVDQINLHRRKIGTFAVLLGRIIGRQKPFARAYSMKADRVQWPSFPSA